MKKTLPYTIEEIKSQKIHIGDGPLPDIERVFATPLLLEDLISYFYQIIKKLHQKVDNSCTIIIDGCIRSSRLKKFRKGKPVELEKQMHASVAIFEKHIAKPLHFDSFRIGETDLKIPRHIGMHSNKRITVFSSDSDSIPILLLNMRDWIDKESGFLKSKIFIDFGARSTAGLRYLDVVELYRSIGRFAISYKVQRPIETMCILMILTGTDYVEKQKSIGPSTILDAFMKGKHELFKFQKETNDSIFKSDSEIGDIHIRHSITLAEYLLKLFVQSCMPKTQSKKRKNSSEPEKPNLGIDSYLRRVFWTLDYWINGSKSNFLDPVAVEPNTGLSLHGWLYDRNLKKVVPAANVYRIQK